MMMLELFMGAHGENAKNGLDSGSHAAKMTKVLGEKK